MQSFESIHHQQLTFQAYAFEQKEDGLGIVVDRVFTAKEGTELCNCFAARLKKLTVLRTSAIDTLKKTAEFQLLISETKRISVVQSHLPSLDWEKIERQHNLIRSKDPDYIALNFPQPKLFSEQQEMPHPSLIKEWNQLNKLQNVEGWYQYCIYLNEEMERVFRTFLPTMVDEYQLESKFKDFHHEVKSMLLRDTLESLICRIGKLNELEQNQGDEESIKKTEKQILSDKNMLFQAMHAHYQAIEQVEIGITKIEKNHPQLLALKRKVIALKQLMSQEFTDVPIDQPILLHQLLNNWLGVLTSVSSDDGLGRVSLEFALRVAISQVSLQFNSQDVLNLVLNWQDNVRALRQQFEKQKDFLSWLKSSTKDESEMQLRKRLNCLYAFQIFFLDCLTFFEKPIYSLNQKEFFTDSALEIFLPLSPKKSSLKKSPR